MQGEPFVQEGLFGGVGQVLVWDLMRGAALPPFSEVLACQLAPGGRVGCHRQEHASEIVIVTAGQGLARVNQVEQAIQAGSLVLLPLGASLELENTSLSQWLDYVIVKGQIW